MIYNKYKIGTDRGTVYSPDRSYSHSEEYKKQNSKFGFPVPAEIEDKKAVPFLILDGKRYNELSTKSKMIAVTLFKLFAYGISDNYPEVAFVEVEGGKYVKFKFQYYFTVDFLKMPYVCYEAVDVVEKKEASKYLVCIDNV